MNTLTQQQINQHQWQVADGVARIVNPYENYVFAEEDKGYIFEQNQLFEKFDEFAKQHQFQTNAPDGIYSGEAFEVIEQISIETHPGWYELLLNEDLTEAMQRIIGTDSYTCDTRLFLSLKPSHLPAVLTTQPGEEWKDRYKEVEEYTHDGINWVVPTTANELYVEKECGSKVRTTWHPNTPPAEQEAVEKEPLVSFKFKHPDGAVLTSAFYSVDDLLKTSIEDIQDKTCTCECQPIGETNVVECNCIDYYEQFEYAGAEWQANQLQSTLAQKDQRIAELEQMLDQCQKNDLYFEQEKEQLNNKIAELEREREWISVDERLPEGQTEVLVYMPKYGSDMNVYFLTDLDPERKTWFNCFFDTKPFSDVTHWMPLPTPPQH